MTPSLNVFALDLATALGLGVVIGLERQLRLHPAGMRTNGLVAVGAALFVSLSQLVDHDHSDPTRIAAQVVSGIGFLGGGVILREGLTVRGMTTAATLWCSAAIGSLAGANLLNHALIGTAGILCLNVVLRPVVRWLDERQKTMGSDVEIFYRLRVVCASDQEPLVRALLMEYVEAQRGMTIRGNSIQQGEHAGQSVVSADIYSSQRNDTIVNDLVSRFSVGPGVVSVGWEKTH